MANSMEVPQKTKNRTKYDWTNPGYSSEEKKNPNMKRYVHSSVHCSIIYNRQDIEAT